MTHYGASQNDWDQLDLVLELTQDLLPVVSDPTATPSPLSKIAGPGKTPSLFNSRGQMIGFTKWTQYKATSADVATWRKDKRIGACLQTRLVRALDCDVSDPDEAYDIEAFINTRLGIKLPIRRRDNSSKFAMLFTLPGDLTKRRFKTKTEGNFVELLGSGQQIVVAGQHTSGARYAFDGGLPDSIPELSREEFEALWSALHAQFGSEDSVTVKTGMTPTKKRRLEDANDEVGEYLESHWTVHDVTDEGRVDILCPWDAGHSTQSGESSTSWFLGGTGGIARGHFRCLHASCAGRTDQDFLNAIGYNAFGFDVIEVEPTVNRNTGATIHMPDLPKAITENFRPLKKGQPPGTETIIPVSNAVFAALDAAHICGHGIIYDTYRDEVMITTNSVDRPLHLFKLTDLCWRPFKDDDYVMLKMWLERGESMNHRFEPVPIESIRLLVKHVAMRRSYDSLTSLVRSYRWDGISRIRTFLSDFMGAEDTPYTRAIAVYYWTALAGRAVVPGIKADMVPIAIGKQGARKTTLIRAIAPHRDMFVELDLSKSDADLARDMRGKCVGELGEMKGFSAKMIEHIKSFITREYEEWTPKYCEYTVKYARRCILFGTTNDTEPLPSDSTGQRRWLPFVVGEGATCSVEELEAIREQLWAEALYLFDLNGVIWQEAERLAPVEHKQFEKDDSWTEHLRDYIFTAEMGEPAPIDSPAGLKIATIISHGLCIPVREITRAVENRVADCLRTLGLRKTTRKVGKVWVRNTAM